MGPGEAPPHTEARPCHWAHAQAFLSTAPLEHNPCRRGGWWLPILFEEHVNRLMVITYRNFWVAKERRGGPA